MDVTLQRLLLGRNGRSQLLTGLRGVGKTVLLDEFSRIAGQLDYVHEHIEISEDGRLTLRLAAAMRRALIKIDTKKRVGEAVVRVLGLLKAFTLTLPEGTSLNIDVPAVNGLTDSGDLA